MRPVRLLALLAVVSVVGAPLGIAWVYLAPTADVTVQEGQPVGVDVGESLIGSDTTLLALLGLAALVVGVLGGLRGTRDGPALPVVLTLGTTFMALIAWQVGSYLGTSRGQETLAAAADGATIGVNVELQSGGVLVAAPLLAVLTFLLVAWRRDAPPAA